MTINILFSFLVCSIPILYLPTILPSFFSFFFHSSALVLCAPFTSALFSYFQFIHTPLSPLLCLVHLFNALHACGNQFPSSPPPPAYMVTPHASDIFDPFTFYRHNYKRIDDPFFLLLLPSFYPVLWLSLILVGVGLFRPFSSTPFSPFRLFGLFT